MVDKIKRAAEKSAHIRTLGGVLVGVLCGVFAAGTQSERIMRMPDRVHALEVFRADSAARAADLAALTSIHAVDILRVERKLDCALWDLPRGCRETMAPR